MAQRKPMLDFISEGDWRLADERQRLLAPLAESENGSVEDVDRVARLLKLSRASVYRLLRVITVRVVKLIESLAVDAILSGRERIDLESLARLDSQPPLLSMDSVAGASA
jgi:hypothetical protein